MKTRKTIRFVLVLLWATGFIATALAYDIDLKGTSLTPDAKGKAEVKRKHGESLIKFKVSNLPPASQLRSDAVTYVLWSLDNTRQEYHNLGEVRVGSRGDERGKAQLDARTALKRFKLLVTAEASTNVTRPSDLVALRSK